MEKGKRRGPMEEFLKNFFFHEEKKREKKGRAKPSSVNRGLGGSSQFHDSNIAFSYCRRVRSMICTTQ